MLPILLAYDPATTSGACARLEDDVNALCAMDLSFTRGLNLLKHLKALNKDQGLGFVIGGVVVTRRTLWLAVSAADGFVGAVGPSLTRAQVDGFRVVDLKKELAARGLKTSGLKAVLKARLLEALGLPAS